MSLPERLLWQRLRGRGDIKVRRQHPVGPFVADFYIARAKLVVEVDGATHAYREAADEGRDAFVAGLGLRVMRIAAGDILADADAVADAIFRAATPLHRPAGGPPPHAAHGEEVSGAC